MASKTQGSATPQFRGIQTTPPEKFSNASNAKRRWKWWIWIHQSRTRPGAHDNARMKPMTDPMSAPPWPPTTYPVPTLWERAKAMFGVLTKRIGSAADLSRWMRLRHVPRTEILCRLVPVEKLTRLLLTIEAITFLLMTPEGARLRRETPKREPPPAPPLPGTKKPITRIAMPGWHTIAALRPRIDPRVAEREARLAAEAPPIDPYDPENWSCRFGVLSWRHPRPDADDDVATCQPAARSMLESFIDTTFPIVLGPTMADLASPKPEQPKPEGDRAAFSLARRIEALARVLADPGPAIRRLAKFLASLPHDALPDTPGARSIDSRWWWHGRPEWFNVNALARPAVRALTTACAPPPEPG